MKIGEFLQNIFSIKDYGETHHILRVFGLKIKFPKSEYAQKKKNSPVFYYKKNNIPITEVPHATGQLRDIQMANLELLKEFDFVCKKNNLEYWIDYGSTLGAIRHKGYIPWDDDIDVGMLRDDYEKIIDVFNSQTSNKDIYAEYYRDKNSSLIIKIKHKKTEYAFVDIFPFDYCSKDVLDKDPVSKTSDIKKLCKKLKKEYKNASTEALINAYKELRRNVLGASEDKDYVVRGLEFCGFPRNWFYAYDTIYPLKDIDFEGVTVKCPNNTDSFLTSLYGNYMAYPEKIGVGHTALITLNDSEISKIREIINKE
ncbi:MAG: LicD family protein [Cyanobacteria bacterium RUI128]|nr:LicD family protein [Cyanobacteria bacterium RUI128]